MLPFVATVLFALIGIAALCVDLGLASVVQLQLESAADELALERLRLADAPEALELRIAELRSRVAGLSSDPEEVDVAADGFERKFALAFARGSMLRQPSELALAGRAHGRLRPALRVGPRGSGAPGLASFALSADAWIALHGPVGLAAADERGFVALAASGSRVSLQGVLADAGFLLVTGAGAEVGDEVSPAATALGELTPGVAYAPIVVSAAGESRVVGFGKVGLATDANGLARVRFDPHPVALVNASARLFHARAFASSDPALVTALRSERARVEQAGAALLQVATGAP